MKSQKLLIGAATACLLVGTSGAAMAVDCANKIIVGEVDEIVIDGQPCYIQDAIVAGDVTITDSPNLDMVDVDVNGTVLVTGTGVEGAELNATLVNLDVFSGDLQVDGQATVIVTGSILRGAGGPETGNLVVNNNAAAVVRANLVVGDLTCDSNLELDANFNRVFGTDDCTEEVVP